MLSKLITQTAAYLCSDLSRYKEEGRKNKNNNSIFSSKLSQVTNSLEITCLVVYDYLLGKTTESPTITTHKKSKLIITLFHVFKENEEILKENTIGAVSEHFKLTIDNTKLNSAKNLKAGLEKSLKPQHHGIYQFKCTITFLLIGVACGLLLVPADHPSINAWYKNSDNIKTSCIFAVVFLVIGIVCDVIYNTLLESKEPIQLQEYT